MTGNYWLGLTAIAFLGTILSIIPIGAIAIVVGIPAIFWIVEIILGALTIFCGFKAYKAMK